MPALRPSDEQIRESQSQVLAVAIKNVRPHQRHVALVYEAVDGRLRMSHLEWHCRFVDEEWRDGYRWVLTDELEEENRRDVAIFLQALRRLSPRIPYGFSSAGCRFEVDPTNGSLKFPALDPGTGLTCATFVTLVFRSRSLPLVDERTWPQRPDDLDWQRSIVAMLEEYGASPEHIAALQQSVGVFRVRPEEVAGAFATIAWPADFLRAAALAREVIAELS